MTTVSLRAWQELKREMKRNHPDYTNQQISIEVDKIWQDSNKKQEWIEHYTKTFEKPEKSEDESIKKKKKKVKYEDSSDEEEKPIIKKKKAPAKAPVEKDWKRKYYKLKYDK